MIRWLKMAREQVHFQGLPARICWLGYGERAKAGLKFNELVAKGIVKAPIVIGRDHLDSGSVASPNRETEGMLDGTDAVSDWPILNALINTAGGRPGFRSIMAAGLELASASMPAWSLWRTAHPRLPLGSNGVLTTDPRSGGWCAMPMRAMPRRFHLHGRQASKCPCCQRSDVEPQALVWLYCHPPGGAGCRPGLWLGNPPCTGGQYHAGYPAQRLQGGLCFDGG